MREVFLAAMLWHGLLTVPQVSTEGLLLVFRERRPSVRHRVSGTDSNTNNVSFYQDGQEAQTNVSGGGTLWCVNNYTMTAGILQTTDANTDILKVGTSGTSPVDGTDTLTGGSIKIYPSGFGTLQIKGTTTADVPILNLGSVTFNFNVDLSNGSNCSKLYVGETTGTGRVSFGYNGGTATIAINPLNSGGRLNGM